MPAYYALRFYLRRVDDLVIAYPRSRVSDVGAVEPRCASQAPTIRLPVGSFRTAQVFELKGPPVIIARGSFLTVMVVLSARNESSYQLMFELSAVILSCASFEYLTNWFGNLSE